MSWMARKCSTKDKRIESLRILFLYMLSSIVIN